MGELDPVVVGFGRVAGDHERARPGYPPEIAEQLVSAFEIASGTRVCDLAAGTGKFTRLLTALGADVVAVEPVVGMRDELARALPDVETLAGTAEDIPLPDESVDAVTVAQAFHWFDAQRALAEIARILRPQGGIALRVERPRRVGALGGRDVTHPPLARPPDRGLPAN
ncbi:MAG: class I SAM-dependent methyltransferase [Acidimicrobiales bacterium]